MAKTLNVRERRELIEDMLSKVGSRPDAAKAALGLAIDHLKDAQLQALSEDLYKHLQGKPTQNSE